MVAESGVSGPRPGRRSSGAGVPTLLGSPFKCHAARQQTPEAVRADIHTGQGFDAMYTVSSDDAVIAGGGAVGLATALALLEAGRNVRVIEARHVGAGSSHGNCGTITPSHAGPLAQPGMIQTALRMMLQPDAPLYIRPRVDPVLWRWLLRFAARCNVRDFEHSARAKGALLNDSRVRLGQWIRDLALECEFVESGE